MRLLVLGAGAVGGYFGARLAEAGGEAAFLVRPARAAALRRDGLRVESPFGDLALRPAVLEEATPGFDAVLLACKAWDLEAAIAAIAPAVRGGACVLPVLNGMAHMERLRAAFGPAAVLGGLARIQATLGEGGVVRHLNPWCTLAFGEWEGGASARTAAIAAAFAGARGVEARAVPDIRQRMWEKLVHLGTAAIGTVLLRAPVGAIARAGGTPLLHRVLERNAAIAAHHGHPMPDAFLAEYRALFADASSAYATSLLRDVQAGRPNEGEAVLGFLLEAARRAGQPADLHEAAWLHARCAAPPAG
ncbi:2-dehydropantoate 2-reductase [Roseococcus sp. DSY-14]|uniref:2-dehydropantoate 2-reductase n=1 Tax=Roseococcus sp. DSY-14 TaxID=3369650 RepID=UPI00387B17D5